MTQEHESAHSQRVVSGSRTFSPARLTAGIIGLVLVVVAGVTMARVGFASITGDTTNVLGLDMTLLMAIINLVVGLLMLGIASEAFSPRSSLMGLGTLMVAFGAVVAIEPDPFTSSLGEGRPVGVLYLVLGVLALIVGFSSRTVVTRESSVVDSHHDLR